MTPEYGLKRPEQVKNSPDQGYGDRVPPGQFLSDKFPVLTHGSAPDIDMDLWSMKVFGLVEQELELNWNGFKGLDWEVVTSDFHCVTQWSSLDNTWEGVRFSTLVESARPLGNAAYVMAHCYGDYTTNIPLDVCLSEGFLAHKRNGEELGKDHGGPLRLIIPSRYAWKSAKWVNGIELLAEDSPGFWEQRGYSNNADPWKEERFWPELKK